MINLNDNSRLTEENRSPRRLLLPSLALSNVVIQPPFILTGLLLIDIGDTFGYTVGVTGQLQTAAALVAAITALLMGVLSVRFKHKSLLLLGLLFFCISAFGCSFALNFNMMFITFSITGLGMAMVTPMIFALIGAHFPLKKRASTIGLVNASASLAYVIGAPIIGFIAGVGGEEGWRWAFLGIVLPVSLLGFLMAVQGVPSPSLPRSSQPPGSKMKYLEGYKGVFANRSAIACFVGNAFAMAGFQVILVYSTSFYRERFQVSTEFASIIFVGAALSFTLGTLVIGRFVSQFEKKPVTVLTGFIAGIFMSSFTNVPNIRLSIALEYLSCLFFGMMITTAYSLTLEQVPSFRGTMMSLNSAATNIGTALGAGIGGWVLLLWDYEFVGLSLGAMILAVAIIYYRVVSDPTRIEVSDRGT